MESIGGSSSLWQMFSRPRPVVSTTVVPSTTPVAPAVSAIPLLPAAPVSAPPPIQPTVQQPGMPSNYLPPGVYPGGILPGYIPQPGIVPSYPTLSPLQKLTSGQRGDVTPWTPADEQSYRDKQGLIDWPGGSPPQAEATQAAPVAPAVTAVPAEGSTPPASSSILPIIIGAGGGLLVGGPVGAVIGGGAGWWFKNKNVAPAVPAVAAYGDFVSDGLPILGIAAIAGLAFLVFKAR